MPTPQGRMSQADFVKKLKEQLPELAQFPDHEIIKYALNEDPKLRGQLDLPDDIAEREQLRLEERARYPTVVDPERWNRHPNIKGFANSVLNTLPGLGALGGAMLAGPETLGMGMPIGLGIGAGAGTGLRDFIAQTSGLEPGSDFMGNASHIIGEGALSAMMPGAIESVMHPIKSLRVAAGMAAKPARIAAKLTPRLIRVDASGVLKEIANGGKAASESLVRPSWQIKPNFPEEPPDLSPLRPTRTGSPTTLADPPNLPWKITAPPRPNIPGPTGTGSTVAPPIGPTTEPWKTTAPARPTVPRPTGTGTPSTPPPNEPTNWTIKVKETPTPKAPVPSEEGITIHGNEERVIRSDWDAKTLKEWMDKGFKSGGKTSDGKIYLTRPIPKKTASNEPIIQHSPSTNKVRGSLDGGKTWRYSNDEGNTWNEEDV